jgi:hypothetical protein
VTQSEAWQAYQRAAGELGELRATERERTGGQARTAATARKQIADLSDKLLAQQTDLTTLARALHLLAPALVPGAAPDGQPVEARLTRVRQCLDEANIAADAADSAADAPLLLPTASPRLRNAAVYGGFSVLGLVAQLVMIGLNSQKVVTSQITMYGWTCCGFPAIAFFAGYIAVGILCRPRKSSTPVDRTPRMGGLICVASLPVYAMVLALVGQLL